eukprot:TRINITY_DN626_c0_g1_i1.p1 TRINITY_DN626_c0_g1~~TRINITY_DN626_c0_g1_i1.p1  ORF type:complete len:769 (-),score=191.50 TRINITY_DN626_c0_g1_i1:137-2443(-)
MSAPQKPWHRGLNPSKAATNPDRVVSAKGKSKLRDKATINRLNMYRTRPKRNAKGEILHEEFQSKELPTTRIAPNRKWFGNTRVIGQEQLNTFIEEMEKTVNNPFQFVMRRRKLPMGLLTDPTKVKKMHILEVESFDSTFGPSSTRKKPRIIASDLGELLTAAEGSSAKYSETADTNIVRADDGSFTEARLSMFDKGQSKRIWGELFKVIDSSDVLIQVLDARDPMGTRCAHIEKTLKKNSPHKHLIFVLNKCDLIPVWATARWVSVLSKEYPTLAMHSSVTNPFGKGSLIHLLRQFAKLHSEKKQICVGLIGYPNVGKSSIINTLRAKKVCKVAPIPGETKVWQYVTLMKRIFLIDCPGVVYEAGDTETQTVLKGVVRIENLPEAGAYIPDVLSRVRKEHLVRTYEVEDWEDHMDFLTQLAKKRGKLVRGGDPDINAVARIILTDWQRGRLPWYVMPPQREELAAIEKAKEPLPLAGCIIPAAPKIEIEKIPEAAAASAKEEGEEKEEEEKDEEQEDEDDEGVEDVPKIKSVQIQQVKQAFSKLKVKEGFNDNEDAPSGEEEDLSDEDNYDWDEVFSSVVGEEVAGEQGEGDGGDKNGEEEESEDEDDEEEEEEDEDDPEADPAPLVTFETSKPKPAAAKGNAGPTQKRRGSAVNGSEAVAGVAAAQRQQKQERKKQQQAQQNREKQKAAHRERQANKGKAKGQGKRESKRKRDDDAGFEEVPQGKTPRRTTNKQKVGTHFYEDHNVKNKNRNRKKPVDPSPKRQRK